MIHWLLISLILGMFIGPVSALAADNGNPKTRVCAQMLESGSSPFKEKVLEYVTEVRAKRSIIHGRNWLANAQLKSRFVKDTMMKMRDRLIALKQNPPFKGENELVERSSDILIEESQKAITNYEKTGMSYLHFIQFSFIFTHHFAFYDSNSERREKIIRAQDPALLRYETTTGFLGISRDGYREFTRPAYDSKILTSPEHLKYQLEQRTLTIERAGERTVSSYDQFDLKYFGAWTNPLVLVPTTATLGFETLVWAQSLGAGFVGVSDVTVEVDGQEFDPLLNYIHDLQHNQLTSRKGGREVWDQLASRLHAQADTTTPDWNLETQMAILFMIFHERSYALDCKTLVELFSFQEKQLENMMARPYPEENAVTDNLTLLIKRLNRANDLGVEFVRAGRRTTVTDLTKAYTGIATAVLDICR